MPKVSKQTASETIALEGLDVVEFSPTDVLGQTIPVVMDNLHAARAASERHP